MSTGAAVFQAGLPYAGYGYVLGAKGKDRQVDCSGLTWLALRDVGVTAPHGTVGQFPWCEIAGLLISVDEAITTEGAGLFRYLGAGKGAGGGNHVAISDGEGGTIEARSAHTIPEVGRFSAFNRGWTHGALWPGVTYTPPPPAAPARIGVDMPLFLVRTAADDRQYVTDFASIKRHVPRADLGPRLGFFGAWKTEPGGTPFIVEPGDIDWIPES